MIEIKIPKFGSDGKIIKNEAGDVIYTTFHYDFEILGMNRKLMAIKFFELAERQIENPPNNDLELAVILQKNYEQRAYEAIFCRLINNDEYELYNPQKTGFSELEFNEIGKTSEQFNLLLEAKNDFFTKVGRKPTDGMKELISLIKPLMELKMQLADEKGQTPSLSEVMQAVTEIANINS